MRIVVAATLFAVAFAPLVLAQDASRDDWEGEAELGVLFTSGNNNETDIDGRLALMHEVERWRNRAEFSTLYSESDEETTAEEYEASLETNYKFSNQQFWYLRGAYVDDRFSGYEYRSSATVGYGNRVWSRGERSFLDLSVGVGYRYNRLEQPNDEGTRTEDQSIGRLAGQYDYGFSENALFRQRLSTEVGLSDSETITESVTALQATVVGNLSMKVAYRVTHLSDPPAGSANTDTETSLSLLYGF